MPTKKKRKPAKKNPKPIGPNTKWIGIGQICERYSVSPMTVYRAVNAGEFPPPEKIFGQNRWKLSDVVKAKGG